MPTLSTCSSDILMAAFGSTVVVARVIFALYVFMLFFFDKFKCIKIKRFFRTASCFFLTKKVRERKIICSQVTF